MKLFDFGIWFWFFFCKLS